MTENTSARNAVIDATHNDLRRPENFRAFRLAQGLSQRQLAKLLEVHFMTVSRWERGETAIPKVVELAVQWLELQLQDGTVTVPDESEPEPRELSPADKLMLDLILERNGVLPESTLWDDAISGLVKVNNINAPDIDAAVAGDKRAMIRLRKACGLKAFK